MSNGFFKVPVPVNEPVFNYNEGSIEKASFLVELANLKKLQPNVPMYIGDQHITTSEQETIKCPYDNNISLGNINVGTKEHVKMAIDAALKAKKNWSELSWESRGAIFLKAADLIAGPFRNRINAATMLCQSKSIHQAEIDAACEFADFLRYDVYYMAKIYQEQPENSANTWNRSEYRPLEGFVTAITPFNFTAIAGNLTAAPALMGNTIVWKPAHSQALSAFVIMEIFELAGLPKGVINLVFVNGEDMGEIAFSHPEFAGLHFTGSTAVFKKLWKQISANVDLFKNYPRIVGETGGKDFVFAHPSANVDQLFTGLVRGAFEFQGQKCSAASRAYIPRSIWENHNHKLIDTIKNLPVGSPEDFKNFVNAVIDKRAFDKITSYIEKARSAKEAEILAGGTYNNEVGNFINPTLILTTNPRFVTMIEEIFGPVLTVYIYEDHMLEDTLNLVNQSTVYALTGGIFAQDRYAIDYLTKKLTYAAGNFYINDKPSGAVVGHQPFGGARMSGTNDKAGGAFNLLRWVSPRTIKENLLPPSSYPYPYMS